MTGKHCARCNGTGWLIDKVTRDEDPCPCNPSGLDR